jgi:hypothetical protein
MNRWSLSLFLTAVLALPATAADTPPSSARETPSPALAYAVAGLSTLLILFTICKPSKKSFFQDE